MEGEDLRTGVWAGAIPVKLELAEMEITTLPGPEPLYTLAPRMGFLSVVAAAAHAHFEGVLPPGELTPWFEFRGLPLKWSIPTGVLFDLLVGDSLPLPWSLTVHFTSYPSDTLPPFDPASSLRSHLFNSLKEAMYIRQGSAQAVMSMSTADQTQMWKAVEDPFTGSATGRDPTASMRSYHAVSDKLTGLPARSTARSVPVRLYVVQPPELGPGPSSGAPAVHSWEQVTCCSRPVTSSAGTAALPVDKACGTLRDVLRTLLPEIFPPQAAPASAAPAAPGGEQGAASEGTPPLEALSLEGEGARGEGPEGSAEGPEGAEGAEEGPGQDPVAGVGVWIQGVQPPLDAPLEWLVARMCHPDLFMHIVVHAPLLPPPSA